MFKKARLKLTAWYLLIIMSISITFSLVIARAVSAEVDRFERVQRIRIENRLRDNDNFFSPNTPPPPTQFRIIFENPELLAETKRRVFVMLGLINAGIFLVAGGLGYMLAGRTLRPIQIMMDEQNRFISDASHELRTPLTSLKSAFEVYLRSKDNTLKEAKTLIGESVEEVNKLQLLSDSLLQLAQYQKPNGQMRFENIRLSEVVRDAVRKIKPVAMQKQVALGYGESELRVNGNRFGLTDLLVILLDNAVKYSPSGAKVEVTAKKTDHHVLVSVKDEGIGIAREDMKHIFSRFYRADSARSRKDTGGYGLGLAIAKKIAETHGGTIEVKSTPGKGSEFTVRLPLFSRNSA